MSGEYNMGGSAYYGDESVRLRVGHTIEQDEPVIENRNRRCDFAKPSRLSIILYISFSLVIAFSLMFVVVWMSQTPSVGATYDLSFSISEATPKPKPTNPTYTPSTSLKKVVNEGKLCERSSSDGRLSTDESSCTFGSNDDEMDKTLVFTETHSGKCADVEFYYPTFTKFCIYPNTTLLINRETEFTIVLPREVLEAGPVLLNYADRRKVIPSSCGAMPILGPFQVWTKCTKFYKLSRQKSCSLKEKIVASDFHLRQDARHKKGWLFGISNVIVPEVQYLEEEIWRDGIVSLRRLTHDAGLNVYRPVQRPEDAFYIAIISYGDKFMLCDRISEFFSIQNSIY